MKVGDGVNTSVGVGENVLGAVPVAFRTGVAGTVGIAVAVWQAVSRRSPLNSIFFIEILL